MAQTRVFISYAHADSAFVDQLANRLKACGIDVWIDKWKIKVGDSITHKINEGIGSSDFLVIVLSRASVDSKWVQEELNAAMIRNIVQERGAFILPILLEDCALPSLLRHRKYANFKEDPAQAFQDLVDALQVALIDPEPKRSEIVRSGDHDSGYLEPAAADPVSALLEVAKKNLAPDHLAQLGAAFGTSMPPEASVIINYYPGRATQMVKQAIISGITSAGINVIDASTVSLPTMCYYIRHLKVSGGVHIRPFAHDTAGVNVDFFDAGGMPLSRSAEEQMAQTLLHKHIRQVPHNHMGKVEQDTDSMRVYVDALVGVFDRPKKDKIIKIAMDYAHSPSADVLDKILDRLGVEVVPLNSRVDQNRFSISREDFATETQQLSVIVGALSDLDFGARISVDGDRIFFVDNQGANLTGGTSAAILMTLLSGQNPGKKVVLADNSSDQLCAMATQLGFQVIATASEPFDMATACAHPDVVFGADGEGRFIFPEFQPVADGLFTVAKLAVLMKFSGVPLSRVVDGLLR